MKTLLNHFVGIRLVQICSCGRACLHFRGSCFYTACRQLMPSTIAYIHAPLFATISATKSVFLLFATSCHSKEPPSSIVSIAKSYCHPLVHDFYSSFHSSLLSHNLCQLYTQVSPITQNQETFKNSNNALKRASLLDYVN